MAAELNSQISTNVNSTTRITNSTDDNSKKWIYPKAFKDESDKIKISMILKWIFGFDSYENIISGKEKIKNIMVRLQKMGFNGYLRLFEIDMSIIKDFMSESSWILFEDFKSKRQLDEWKCPHCSSLFSSDSMKWKCDRCLFWHHVKCAKAILVSSLCRRIPGWCKTIGGNMKAMSISHTIEYRASILNLLSHIELS